MVDRTVPTKSSAGASASFELGTIRATATIATITNGTLTRKIEPHQ